MKQLTPKLNGDTISDDITPASGRSELINLLQLSDFDDNTTIRLEIELVFTNSILKFLSKIAFFQENATPLICSDSPEN